MVEQVTFLIILIIYTIYILILILSLFLHICIVQVVYNVIHCPDRLVTLKPDRFVKSAF